MKKVMMLVLAFVLCMSVGMVSLAARSPEDPIPSFGTGATGTDKDGNKVTIGWAGPLADEVEAMLKDEQKVKDILTEAGYILNGDETVAVLGAQNICLKNLDYNKIDVPEGGVDLTIPLQARYYDYTNKVWIENEEVANLKDGDRLYILHQKADGTWEVLEGTAVVKVDESGNKTYAVAGHFDSLSPVAVIKVMSNGEVVVLENNKKVGTIDPKKGTFTTSVVKKSPKTGA